ncbi:hypothetical protein CROQUDRAFT_96996, partial [Cronartium quercuum f. sp. fusiforme G11]
ALTTDVAVVVVAADEGSDRASITKCDKPGLDLHRTRASIYGAGLEIESLGGEVPCVEVSAVTGKGLAELAETIVAVAEVRELRAETEGVRFEGRVIESDVGRECGNVATIIALRGTLVAGMDLVAAGTGNGWKTLPKASAQVLGAESEEEAK